MRLLSADEVFPMALQAQVSTPNIQHELLGDAVCGPALRVYLAFTSGAIGLELSSEDRFYNRYYWFLRFADAHRRKFGPDAGIEQQAVKILEHPGCDVDWKEISRVEAAARRGSRLEEMHIFISTGRFRSFAEVRSFVD